MTAAIATDLRHRASTYVADASALRSFPDFLQDDGFTSAQWIAVYEEIARQLRLIAAEIDGRDP